MTERMLAYVATRADALSQTLAAEGVDHPEGAEGLGAGVLYFQGDEVLQRKRPAGPTAFSEAVRELRTPSALIHLGQPVRGSFKASRVGPFRYGTWVFSQVGGGHPEALRMSEVGDHLRRALPGGSFSERLFARVLTGLASEGISHQRDPDDDAVTRVLLAARDEARSQGATEPFAAILSTGRRIYGLTSGRRLRIREIEAGADTQPFRAALLDSDLSGAGRATSDDGVCILDRDARVRGDAS